MANILKNTHFLSKTTNIYLLFRNIEGESSSRLGTQRPELTWTVLVMNIHVNVHQLQVSNTHSQGTDTRKQKTTEVLDLE